LGECRFRPHRVVMDKTLYVVFNKVKDVFNSMSKNVTFRQHLAFVLSPVPFSIPTSFYCKVELAIKFWAEITFFLSNDCRDCLAWLIGDAIFYSESRLMGHLVVFTDMFGGTGKSTFQNRLKDML
jgi:hypothetical protein